MRLRRHVNRIPPGDPVGADRAATGPVQRREQGNQRRARRRILDDPAAGGVGAEMRGQPEQFGQPVQDDRLQLCAGRAGRPHHALHAEPGREQIAEDRWPARVRREVREEARMLPVRDAGQDQAAQVGQHLLVRLALLGRMRGQRRPHLTGPHLRPHRMRFDRAQVVGDPVDHLLAIVTELLWRHVPRHGHLRRCPLKTCSDPGPDRGRSVNISGVDIGAVVGQSKRSDSSRTICPTCPSCRPPARPPSPRLPRDSSPTTGRRANWSS